MSWGWRKANTVRLLANGEQYYPRVFAAIEAAEKEILLETFILFEDKVGKRLHELLLAAAKRGVRIGIMVDGFGTPELSQDYVRGLADAGVRLRVYGPGTRIFNMRINLFRRMHRKHVVIDRRVAFTGGMNFGADHLGNFGPEAKQDYQVELEGPIVEDIHAFLSAAMDPDDDSHVTEQSIEDYPEQVVPETLQRGGEIAMRDPDREPALQPDPDGEVTASGEDAEARLVVRDNRRHRTAIEQVYRKAIAGAERRLIIANAYFFPGYRLLHEIRKAARRGVEVHLLLQGEPDEPIAMYAARLLYRSLVADGVHVHEYCQRPFHGKVAVIDEDWSTVGSSNLDPLSLSLNLEANVFIRSRRFATETADHLMRLIDEDCAEVDPARFRGKPGIWESLRNTIVFHILRRFPAWAGLLPAHVPHIAMLGPRGSRPAHSSGSS